MRESRRVSDEGGPLMLHLAADQNILIYPKPEHTPATSCP
jgi:hypothetical protein